MLAGCSQREILSPGELLLPGPSLVPRGQMGSPLRPVAWLACLHPWSAEVRASAGARGKGSTVFRAQHISASGVWRLPHPSLQSPRLPRPPENCLYQEPRGLREKSTPWGRSRL